MATDWKCVPRTYEVTKNHFILDNPKNICFKSWKAKEEMATDWKFHAVTVVESKGTKQCFKDNQSSFSSTNSSRASSSVSLLAEPLSSAFDGTDPLSQFARQEHELKDPLSQMATEYQKKKSREKIVVNEDDLNWSSKRLAILNRFTTSEKLSISTSFLSTGSSGGDAIKAQTVVADKINFVWNNWITLRMALCVT
ncbi:unnamed protein product [Ceratitis capitata]|uniref:(Mediterranean fruit fly) hypothetical protein n=1 Tax=Ceratitis capitata TaxID=7213 RepID=A0A811TYY1_CERCA|nr:unnamed protein product [Ceratitis capitata]